MLLLKRRRDQVVRIGPDVTVHVIRIEDGAVVLGITAPPQFRVSREQSQSDGADVKVNSQERG